MCVLLWCSLVCKEQHDPLCKIFGPVQWFCSVDYPSQIFDSIARYPPPPELTRQHRQWVSREPGTTIRGRDSSNRPISTTNKRSRWWKVGIRRGISQEPHHEISDEGGWRGMGGGGVRQCITWRATTRGSADRRCVCC